jgi:hypothetical protein
MPLNAPQGRSKRQNGFGLGIHALDHQYAARGVLDGHLLGCGGVARGGDVRAGAEHAFDVQEPPDSSPSGSAGPMTATGFGVLARSTELSPGHSSAFGMTLKSSLSMAKSLNAELCPSPGAFGGILGHTELRILCDATSSMLDSLVHYLELRMRAVHTA